MCLDALQHGYWCPHSMVERTSTVTGTERKKSILSRFIKQWRDTHDKLHPTDADTTVREGQIILTPSRLLVYSFLTYTTPHPPDWYILPSNEAVVATLGQAASSLWLEGASSGQTIHWHSQHSQGECWCSEIATLSSSLCGQTGGLTRGVYSTCTGILRYMIVDEKGGLVHIHTL